MKNIFGLAPAALLLCAFSFSPAFAAPAQKLAWVSKLSGNDAADCGSVANPCRTFQFAHDNIVVAGGTIYVRDSGGYGPVAISKAISIINDGNGVASISASVDGVTVAAGVSDAVFIKGLTIDGAGVGLKGIKVQSVGNVTITDCTVKGFKDAGIFLGSASGVKFGVINSMLTDNHFNVSIQPSGSSASGFLQRVVMTKGDIGVNADGTSTYAGAIVLSLEESLAAQNGQGLRILGANVTAQGFKAVNNQTGAFINSGFLFMSRSEFIANAGGDVSVSGTGKAISAGDNVIDLLSGNLTPFALR